MHWLEHFPQVAGLFLVSWLCLGLYRCLLHPLARFPGPVAAKLTSLYMAASTLANRNTYARYDLHRKYGKVVRIGPNELSFCDEASIKDIYGQSTEPCLKSPFYRGFTLTGTSSVFSATDRSIHSRMRRLLTQGFSQRGVLRFERQISAIVEKYLSNIEKSSQPVDLYEPTNNLNRDIISQLAFAKSFDTLSGKKHQGAADIETYFKIAPLFGIVPIARHFPFGLFRAAKEAQPRIVRSMQSCIDEFREQLRLGTAQNGLLRQMVEAKDEDTGTTFSDAELIENAVIFIVAGSGTSATTVVELLYELAKRPALQKRVQDEIRQAFLSKTATPSYEVATKLPYLNCVLQETLRLRGPLQSPPRRISPGKVIGEVHVPAGVVVSNLPYATGRDPSVFPDPDEFKPERWEIATAAMKGMNRPFSVGPMNCAGMHLARVQMLLTICGLYQRFDLKLDSCMTDEMMALRDQGLMSPIGEKLWMHATPTM